MAFTCSTVYLKQFRFGPISVDTCTFGHVCTGNFSIFPGICLYANTHAWSKQNGYLNHVTYLANHTYQENTHYIYNWFVLCRDKEGLTLDCTLISMQGNKFREFVEACTVTFMHLYKSSCCIVCSIWRQNVKLCVYVCGTLIMYIQPRPIPIRQFLCLRKAVSRIWPRTNVTIND